MAKRNVYNQYEMAMLDRFNKAAEAYEGDMEKPARTEATKDSIILSCRWGDPWNPLWSDEEYAKNTKWGGIIAMPLYTDRVDIFSYWPTIAPEGGFIDHNLYGGTWTNLKPIRPGDTFRVYQHRPTLTDISSIEGDDEPRTFGFVERNADVYNQNGELVSSHQHLLDIIIRPEAKQAIADALPFEDHVYSPEELSYIDQVIANEIIRGADTRFYEDVTVGEHLPDITIGPTTPMDMMAFYASHEEIPVAPMRVFREEGGEGGLVLDAETNVTHFAAEWHIINDRARMLGNPRAFHFGDSARTQMVRCATNWMGDDAEIIAVDYRHITRTPIGDCQVGHGIVIDKYVEDGIGYAVLDIWLDNQCRGNVTEAAKIIVKLESRGALTGKKQQPYGQRAFAVGDKVRVGDHPNWWPGGNPLAGAIGEVIKLYAWDEAYAPFPEYVGVRIDPASTKTKLGIGTDLMFRGEFLEKICDNTSPGSLSASYCSIEGDILHLDVEKLGAHVGVQAIRTGPGPMGIKREWKQEHLQKAVALSKALNGFRKVVLTGWHRCSSWVVAAIANALLPAELTMIVPPFREDQDERAVRIPIAKMGPNSDRSDVRYEVIEEADKVYVRYFHRENSNSGHSFDLALMDEITVPEVSPQKPVYLFGIGTNTTITPIALKYMQTAPGVWMMYTMEEGFTCVSGNEDGQLGQFEPDTRFRFWAPENRPQHP